jgi:4-hydroxy-4-methyl-2-oxoglutarate aldolase
MGDTLSHDNLISMITNATTAHLADACLRLGVPVRCTPLHPVVPGDRASGRVLPVRHVGSVDVFLEALETAERGQMLVVDNGGRLDEACIGDLIAREARIAGIAGIVIWGLHRDNREIVEIGLPIFSLGVLPVGPQRLDARPPDVFTSAAIGPHLVTADDLVIADDDGVLFVPRARLDEIVSVAETIRETERRQATAMIGGRSLRTQLGLPEYLRKRQTEPSYSFRQHLKDIAGAIEE